MKYLFTFRKCPLSMKKFTLNPFPQLMLFTFLLILAHITIVIFLNQDLANRKGEPKHYYSRGH